MSGLFLPPEWAAEMCQGLSLPALETLLARGKRESAAETLETLLCRAFGMKAADGEWPVAASLRAQDGLTEAGGYWLCAEPVHLVLQRDKVVLLPVGGVGAQESAALVASLNQHFAEEGLAFFAPSPQRWYLRMEAAPGVATNPPSQVWGRDIRVFQSRGEAAVRWHSLNNEIQMLLHAHPVNEARAARGAAAINGLWLWGGGEAADLTTELTQVSADHPLAERLAGAAAVPFSALPERWQPLAEGEQLLVWTALSAALAQGDWAVWRTQLQRFEHDFAQPLLAELRTGRLHELQFEVVAGGVGYRWNVTPGAAWALWRRPRSLGSYSV
ncbi:MAG: hypothetical protein HY849_02225 [Nitrosomonadales bacterium]|nr:hypothetical protein [Nitrosomonadales bacterium]